MGAIGRYVMKFSDANMASMMDLDMEGEYHFRYDIEKIEAGRITVRSHKDGSVSEHVITRDRDGFDCFHVRYPEKPLVGERAWRGLKVLPFKGERT